MNGIGAGLIKGRKCKVEGCNVTLVYKDTGECMIHYHVKVTPNTLPGNGNSSRQDRRPGVKGTVN
jgi:hypothetical protein